MGRGLTFTQKSVNSFSEPANNSGWFDGELYKNRYFVGARGTSGVSVVDYDDPENPVEASSIQISFDAATMPGNFGRTMGLCMIGDMAYAVCRRGSGTADGFGIIEEFDVSDPSNITATGNLYDPNSSTLTAYNPGTSLTYLYSDVDTDGTNLFVAGQVSGYYKFDPADLSSGPIASIEVTEEANTETQGVTYCRPKDLVIFANYRFGIRILDNASWGGSINHEVAQYAAATHNLRPWKVATKGNWLFACVNVNAPNESSTERGLLTLDLSGDVTTLTASDWNYAQIPTKYNDTWNSQGDAPQNDISILGDYCYVSNGQEGVLCWYIADPASPVFVGVIGDIISGDNLYLSKAVAFRGTTALIYGDGFNSTSGSKSLYFAEINQMPFTIGNYGSTATATAGVATTIAISHDVTNKTYTAVEGDIVTDYALRVQDAVASRTYKIALYSVSSSVPDVLVPGSEATVTNSNTTGTEFRNLTVSGLSIALTAGVEYCVCVTMTVAGTGLVAQDGGADGSRDNTVTGGNFNPGWTESVTNIDAAVAALGRNISGGGGNKGGGIRGIIRGKIRG